MTLGKIISLLVICLVATVSAYPVRRWTYAEEEGDTNYDFGLAFGKEFGREIKVRLSSDISLKKLVEEFGTENNHVYEQFMASHKNAFPEYMDELQGGDNRKHSRAFRIAFRKTSTVNPVLDNRSNCPSNSLILHILALFIFER